MYSLRLTEAALDDLDLPRELGRLSASSYADRHPVVNAFVAQRSQDPRGQEQTQLPATKAIVHNLHHGRYRGLTWLDADQGVVWLLGVGWHESGSRDDAYEVLKARDSAGDLFPKECDYRNLVPDAASFAQWLIDHAEDAVRRSLECPGEEIVESVDGVLNVSLLAECVGEGGEKLCELFLSCHMPPTVGQVLPGNWVEVVLAAFYPMVDPHDIRLSKFPRSGPVPQSVQHEMAYAAVIDPNLGW